MFSPVTHHGWCVLLQRFLFLFDFKGFLVFYYTKKGFITLCQHRSAASHCDWLFIITLAPQQNIIEHSAAKVMQQSKQCIL